MSTNAADLTPGIRYRWGFRACPSTGIFVRYDLSDGHPLAIFVDTDPLYGDNSAETEMCVGVSGLINTVVEICPDDQQVRIECDECHGCVYPISVHDGWCSLNTKNILPEAAK